MYIIDKNKDFYDYYSHIYGVDKKVVFDRRGSIALTDDIFMNKFLPMSHYINKNREIYIILEVGYTQYLIRCKNIKISLDDLYLFGEYISSDMEIVRVFNDHKHYYPSPISLSCVDLRYYWKWGVGCIFNFNESYIELISEVKSTIHLPILAKTYLTHIIPPFEIWEKLQTYISSLNNDLKIDDLTNDEKIGVHGFDKKSFRK